MCKGVWTFLFLVRVIIWKGGKALVGVGVEADVEEDEEEDSIAMDLLFK